MNIQISFCEMPQTAAVVVVHTIFFLKYVGLSAKGYMEAVRDLSMCISLEFNLPYRFTSFLEVLEIFNCSTGQVAAES